VVAARGAALGLVSEPLLLGIDGGTTAVKVALFDGELRALARARRELAVEHPQPGWVEQDPEAILEAVVDAVAEVLAQAGGRQVLAAGIDHQGESVLAWDARERRTLTPVLVWQDKRQLELLAAVDARVAERSRLPLDPYFSAGKLAWLLAHDERVRRAAERGTLRMGTVDAFLVDRLAGRYATDLSTASRTQLLAFGGRDWDAQLLAAFGVERRWLPAIGPSFGRLGELRHPRWPQPLALAAQLVDQQAALAGSGAVRAGELKATYGTGVFVLGRTDGPALADGLLPTVAWAGADEVAYALDGGVFAAGSLLDWLARDLGLAADARALAGTAAGVRDSAGVLVLPALSGLGAPWWQPRARGVIAGLHAGARPAHIARAALEAIAWRVADVVEAMAAVGPVRGVRVDGGLTGEEALLRIQADALGLPLTVGDADATVLGAALLAGVGAGLFASVEEAAARLPAGRVLTPSLAQGECSRRHARWRAFVRDSARLAG
jgi:glycerol kinase